MTSKPHVAALLVPGLVLAVSGAATAQETEDAFLAGYAAAILEHEFQIPKAVVTVRSGVLYIAAKDLGNNDQERVRAVLGKIHGVRGVEFDRQAPALPARPTAGPDVTSPPGAAAVQAVARADDGVFLLKGPLLFEALHADPHWPHFSAALHHFSGNEEVRTGGVVGFGESFSFYRRTLGSGARWEFGMQAGVNAIFDMEAESSDLVNADYFVGPLLAFRDGSFSLLARLMHESSHLGDEYLLRTRTSRVNLSYEALELLASWDATDALRLYVGGGALLDPEPDLDTWKAQGGGELFGPLFSGTSMRPLIAVDVQAREHADWHRDISVRAGIQFESSVAHSQRVQVLLEYYKGSSPHGQFLVEDVEFYGLGVHFHF